MARSCTTPVDGTTQLPTGPGTINVGMIRRDEATPHPVITIGVASMEAALHDVEAKGGTTMLARTAIPGMGAYAYFTDSEGNVMGVGEPGRRSGAVRSGPGTVRTARWRTSRRG